MTKQAKNNNAPTTFIGQGSDELRSVREFSFDCWLFWNCLTFCAKPNTSRCGKCVLLWLLSVDVSVPLRTSLLLRLLSVEVSVPLVLLPPKAEQFSKCIGFLLKVNRKHTSINPFKPNGISHDINWPSPFPF